MTGVGVGGRLRKRTATITVATTSSQDRSTYEHTVRRNHQLVFILSRNPFVSVSSLLTIYELCKKEKHHKEDISF